MARSNTSNISNTVKEVYAANKMKDVTLLKGETFTQKGKTYKVLSFLGETALTHNEELAMHFKIQRYVASVRQLYTVKPIAFRNNTGVYICEVV